jgi:hypothetical protein
MPEIFGLSRSGAAAFEELAWAAGASVALAMALVVKLRLVRTQARHRLRADILVVCRRRPSRALTCALCPQCSGFLGMSNAEVPAKSQAARSEHAFYAFDVLDAKLNGRQCPPPCFPTDVHYPLFVTWNKRGSSPTSKYRLRGCIGNFSPMPIAEGLEEYALVSYGGTPAPQFRYLNL